VVLDVPYVEFAGPVGLQLLTIFRPTATATGCKKKEFPKNRTATAKNRNKSVATGYNLQLSQQISRVRICDYNKPKNT
jgi:hypothetical protein